MKLELNFKLIESISTKKFNQDYNQPYRDWFFSYFPKEIQQLLKTIYYNQFVKIKENMHFFDWLNHYVKDTKISSPNYDTSICVVERQTKL